MPSALQFGSGAALLAATSVWPQLSLPSAAVLALVAALMAAPIKDPAAMAAGALAGGRCAVAGCALWLWSCLVWTAAEATVAAASDMWQHAIVFMLSVAALRALRGCWLHPTVDAAAVQLYWALRERLTAGAEARAAGFLLGADDVSAAWLTSALQPKFAGIRVKQVRMEPVGADMGNASTFYRLHCDYGGDVQGPETMMLKLPKRDLTNRVTFAATQMYRSEAGFYEHIQRDFPLHGPETYAAAYRERGANFYVLMSDLAGKFRFPKEVHGCEPVEAVAAVRALATFHARFWQSPRLRLGGDLSWVVSQDDPRLSLPGTFMKAGWKAFLRRLGGRLPDYVVERGLSLAPHAKAVQDWQAQAPWTLVHGDAHLENMLFRDAAGGVEVGLYDWQLMRRGKGMLDVAHFVGGSCDTHRGHDEMELLRQYVSALESCGVEGYTLEAALLDYRMSLATLFCWHVSAAIAIPFDTEAHVDYDMLALRICAAVARNDALTVAIHVAAAPKGLAPCLALPGPPDHFRAVGPAQPLHCCSYTVPPAPSTRASLKRAIALKMVSAKGGHHGQSHKTASPLARESAHDVTWAKGTDVARFAFDSYYLSGFAVHEDSPSVALRCCHRGKGDGEIWCMVRVPGTGNLRAPVHPGSNAQTTVSGGGITSSTAGGCLRLQMREPLQEWTAEYKGALVTDDGTELQAELSLTWKRAMDVFSFADDASRPAVAAALAAEPWSRAFFDELRASHQEHYEQFGAVEGELHLAGRTIPVRCKGMRDRAWGLRDWAYFPRYTTHYFTARAEGQPDTFFNVTIVSLPTMTHMISGFVAAEGGAGVPVDEMSGVLPALGDHGIPPTKYSFGFSAAGQRYDFRAMVNSGDTQGLNMGEDRMWVNFRWTRFEVIRHGRDPVTFVGFGASEFGYRFADAQPHRTTDRSLRPTEH